MMEPLGLLRFAHFIGLTLMGGGLLGVFVADMRSRQTRDLNLFGQAVSLIALFYDGLVVPGAIILLGSGTWLIVEYYDGWGFLETPWLAGMVLLFGFEFIEGNTVTRLFFMRMRRLTRLAIAEGQWTPELVRARGEQLASFTHFLDLPMLLIIISLGVLRPDNWTHFLIGSGLAIAVATALNFWVPRIYPWKDGVKP
jgi:uncharacterized membrane protein